MEKNDLVVMRNILDMTVQRGAIRGEEIYAVAGLRAKLDAEIENPTWAPIDTTPAIQDASDGKRRVSKQKDPSNPPVGPV